MKAADPFTGDAVVERQPGQFARHAKTGAPYVAHPTETTKHNGKKADLIALCAERGIDWRSDLDIDPGKTPTIADLQHLLGPRAKKVQYGRPSSLGKQIENQTNLQKWSERMVALGLALANAQTRDDASEFAAYLLADAIALADLDKESAEFKEAADSVARRAKTIAQAGLAADRGTHTHELTEDHDTEVDWIERARRGEDLGIDHAVQAALVAAWAKMLADFDIEILATEAQCVDDVWRQAGTLDRICRLRRELRFVTVTGEFVTLPAGWVGILDIKTGRLRLDYGGFVAYWHGYSVQLASYAQSVPYDPDNDTRGDWPWPIDQRWAVIAHLDVLAALDGEAVCRLVLVDLEAGRHAGNLCVAARDWEKRTDVFSIPTDDLAVRVPVQIATAGASPSAPAVATDVVSALPAPEPPRAVPDATHCDPAVDTGADTATRKYCGTYDEVGECTLPRDHEGAHFDEDQQYTFGAFVQIAPTEPPPPPAPEADTTTVHDCGHICCTMRAEPHHDHFLDAATCPGCATYRAASTTIAPPEQPLPPAPEADTPAAPDALTSVERQQAGVVPEHTAPAPNSLAAEEPTSADKELSPLRAAQLTRQRQITEADAKRRLHDTPEEGTMSDDRTFLLLQHRFEKLPKAGKDWIGHLGREAEDAKVGFSSRHTKTARRYEILRSLVVLAERDESDDAVRDLLALVDPRIEQLGSVPLGHIVGSLSATEAATFAQLVNDELTVVIDDDGTTKLVAA